MMKLSAIVAIGIVLSFAALRMRAMSMRPGLSENGWN